VAAWYAAPDFLLIIRAAIVATMPVGRVSESSGRQVMLPAPAHGIFSLSVDDQRSGFSETPIACRKSPWSPGAAVVEMPITALPIAPLSGLADAAT
jgi:hypothetical protein